MSELLLNCDLGEHESAERTEQLMALIDAANIGCGTHAGSLSKTRATLESALRHDVRVGAHPGLAAAGGRGAELPNASDFHELLQSQLGCFLQMAGEVGVPVGYVKLHGSLYHAVEQDEALAEVFVDCIKDLDRSLSVFSLAGGCFADRARAAGLRVWEEVFADRGYLPDGRLVPRSAPGAVIEDVAAAVERIALWLKSGQMVTERGRIELPGQTLCVHSDSANALSLLKALKALLG